MQSVIPLACFLSMIRPPGIQFENSLLQIAPVDKAKCPFVRDINDIGFRLYTRHNPTVYQELVIDDDEKLFASNMDYHARTVIYFHAFMENPDDGSAAMMREAFVLRGDTNIIMVDASRLEAGPWYFTAAENTWYIGKFAAQFIDYLVSRGLDLQKTHLIGHSLGAQAAGVAGSALKSGRVSRITGLDPALPLFHGLPEEQRLDRSDAEFVDVIHTDGGIFGVNKPMGHADFYPNGGISPQPGCELEVVIPQKLLLNKCENRTQTRGFYTYYLTPHRITKSTQHLQGKLQKLFNFIHAVEPIKSFDSDRKKFGKKGEAFKSEGSRKAIDEKNQAKTINIERHSDITNKDKEILKYDDQIMIESEKKYRILKLEIPIEVNDEYNQGTMKPIINKDSSDVNRQEGADFENIAKGTFDDKVTDDISKYSDEETYTEPRDVVINEDGIENRPTPDYIDTYEITTEINNEQTKTLPEIYNFEDNIEKLIQQDLLNKQTNTHTDPNTPQEAIQRKNHVVKRQKRFISLFRRSEAEESENFLFRMLNFLLKNRRNVLPVYSVMREINTLVKSANGELNHITKERNNFIGAPPPVLTPVTYSLELGNENRVLALVKRVLGLAPKGDRLTINGSGK